MQLRFEVVLFDWMLTLAHYPTRAEHVAWALRSVSGQAPEDLVDDICGRLRCAESLDDLMAAAAQEDTSAVAHRRYNDHLAERAGIEPELAEAMYALLGTPAFHPVYPDAREVLARLRRSGVRIGVVSDIHVDLRRHAADAGIGDCIDHWSLSFELGVQKPDPQMFQSSLDYFGCDPVRVLMVGDQASKDGAAAHLGITCLITPAPDSFGTRGLDVVLQAVGIG